MFYIVFELHRNVHICATRCPIEMGFRSKCGILNGRLIYAEESKLRHNFRIDLAPYQP